MAVNLAPLLARRTPFFYGWVVLFSAGTSTFVRNAAASLTIAVFVYPLSQELGWSRTLIAGAASLGGLAATWASPAVGWLRRWLRPGWRRSAGAHSRSPQASSSW